MVDTFGTGTADEERISAVVREVFSLKPKDIITSLNLLRPIYKKTAAYGHFGRELPEFTWEARDKVPALQAAIK
jgi:S-adenosylmethionine synthetase